MEQILNALMDIECESVIVIPQLHWLTGNLNKGQSYIISELNEKLIEPMPKVNTIIRTIITLTSSIYQNYLLIIVQAPK